MFITGYQQISVVPPQVSSSIKQACGRCTFVVCICAVSTYMCFVYTSDNMVEIPMEPMAGLRRVGQSNLSYNTNNHAERFNMCHKITWDTVKHTPAASPPGTLFYRPLGGYRKFRCIDNTDIYRCVYVVCVYRYTGIHSYR